MSPPRRSPKRNLTAPRTLVLDAGGLSNAATGNFLARGLVRKALTEDADVIVSAVTLTETLRGTARDVAVHRTLKNVEVRVESTAKLVLRARGQSPSGGTSPSSRTRRRRRSA